MKWLYTLRARPYLVSQLRKERRLFQVEAPAKSK